MLTSFRSLNKICSDVHSCLFCALSKYEKTIGSEVLRYGDLSRHIKEQKKWYLKFEFLKIIPNLIAVTMFNTRSNLLCLVCMLSVSSLGLPLTTSFISINLSTNLSINLND